MCWPCRWTTASESLHLTLYGPGPGRVRAFLGSQRGADFATISAFSVPSEGLAHPPKPAAALSPQVRDAHMLETNPIHNLIKDLSERTDVLRGYL